MNPKLAHLYSLYAASGFDKQQTLVELLGGKHDWDFNMESGTITFNGTHSFPVQIIGTESTASKTWLWSWANAESGIPEQLVAAARKLKAFGGEHQIDELKAPQLRLGEVDGMVLSTIATGLTRGDACYRGPYDGGALYVVLQSPALRAKADASPQHIVSIFAQVIAAVPVDHRKAWKAYLEQKGYRVAEEAGRVVGTSPKGERVMAKFDARGRAIDIGATIAP